MGNVASSNRGGAGGVLGASGGLKPDSVAANVDNSPLGFHNVHGENIRWDWGEARTWQPA